MNILLCGCGGRMGAAVAAAAVAAGDRIAPKVYVLDLTTGRMVGCSDESGWKVTK